MKGPVSYEQRTTTLKGFKKVNDMIGEGQEAISSKIYLSAIGQKGFDSQVEKCEKSQNQIKRIDLF